jgi:hypothetical protein
MAVTSMRRSLITNQAKYDRMSGSFGNAPYPVEYLVIGGGSYGGYDIGGGGGAGGFREGTAEVFSTYSVVIGAGAVTFGPQNPSRIFGIEANGGGNGQAGPGFISSNPGGSGGGGGGYSGFTAPAAGNTPATSPSQGNSGGTGVAGSAGGGGGGAGGVGGNAAGGGVRGAKGAGKSSSISGSAVTYAEGGQGASTGAQGVGGGTTSGMNGGANTGGGGGANNAVVVGGNGGSGVVIFRVAPQASVTFSAGVTQTSTTVGPWKVYTVTATSTTSETVTIS